MAGDSRSRSRDRSRHHHRKRHRTRKRTPPRSDTPPRSRTNVRSRTHSRSHASPPSRSVPRSKSPVQSRMSPERIQSVDNSLNVTLNAILNRLNVLEKKDSADRSAGIVKTVSNNVASSIVTNNSDVDQCAVPLRLPTTNPEINCHNPVLLVNESEQTGSVNCSNRILSTPARDSDVFAKSSNVNTGEDSTSTAAQTLMDVFKSFCPSRNQNYFVSNFDPTIHDIDTWCNEVDRAKVANGWTDGECLSRVAGCLKGDARLWLNEWVTSDRTWSNFKLEFRPLCPRKLDYANILFDTMCVTSDKFPTYAEYARRTLLRLRIVKGLSSELITQIVIRGITEPHVRAAVANADLSPDNLVSFLAIYTKPVQQKQDTRGSSNHLVRKRAFNQRNESKCFHCGQAGHKNFQCPKRKKLDSTPDPKPVAKPHSRLCEFCKKPGHTEANCFAKDRAQSRNERNVNLCSERLESTRSSDITSAVVQGVPIDVLIDSGALNVSLISDSVLKHFTCQPKPIKCAIKGISDRELEATSYVTLTIEFSEISVEVDLVVVPSKCMTTPIIIGTDVLNRDGITYVRTKDRQVLTRSEPKVREVCAVEQIDGFTVNTPLQGEQLESLMQVLTMFSEFLITGTAATTVTTGSMDIRLKDETPVAYRPYRLSHQEKVKVREIINDLLSKGIIRESQSDYSSPILLVKKKDGSDRLCVDFRALNRLTIKDRYPLPLIDDHIDRLGSFKYFSSLDMATGFHQIPISESSISKTGFVTPEGHYEYVKMPFGLANAPIVYQRIINNTLRSFIEAGNTLIYIDDVLLMSSEVDEGIELLRNVLKTLSESGFSINLSKCSFLTTQVEYLGRVISQGQVQPSPRKVEALVNSPVPGNVKQVRQFLGLAGYFRRYIEGYSTKTACIAHLTKKNVKFYWGPEQEKVRQEIIGILTSAPILSIFDPALPTEVHTDASSAGYGAVLMQTHKDGKKKVVAYFSKVTQGAESRYHSYELETLAVVKALQHFRHYLIGLQFKVVTDCNALKSTERKKDLLPRVARWWVYLQDFTFDIEYRKGSMMAHADYLSRNPPIYVHQVTKPRNWAQIAQSADGETQDLVQQLQEGKLDSRRYVYQNDVLYYKYSPVGEESRLLAYIPKGHRLSLLRLFHDEHDHICADKTIDLILRHFWFPALIHFVKKYIAHCLVCISNKRVPRAPHQHITSWEKPDAPFQTVHTDALGPLPASNGYKFVLVVVDAFTKYCLLYPIFRQDAVELKRVMANAVSLFGVPKLIVADRGRMFESSSFVNWVKEHGSDIHYITPEMHHSNGQAERYIRTVLNMIRIEVNHKGSAWSEVLGKLQLILNITKQKSTQASALNLLIGTDGTTPVIQALVKDVAAEGSRPNYQAWREIVRSRASELLKKNQTQQDSYVNRNRTPARVFNVNDLVFVIKFSQSTGKLDPGMRGPYKVLKALPSGRYELKLLSGAYGKTSQAAAEYMVPWKGEWCPESCAAFFEGKMVILVSYP